jgi:hypothetical protein
MNFPIARFLRNSIVIQIKIHTSINRDQLQPITIQIQHKRINPYHAEQMRSLRQYAVKPAFGDSGKQIIQRSCRSSARNRTRDAYTNSNACRDDSKSLILLHFIFYKKYISISFKGG